MKFVIDPSRLDVVVSRLSKVDRTIGQGVGQCIEIRAVEGTLSFAVFNESAEVAGYVTPVSLEAEANEVRYVDFKAFAKLLGGVYVGEASFSVTDTETRVTQGTIKLKVPGISDKTGRIRYSMAEVETEFELGRGFFEALNFVAIGVPKRVVGRGKYAGAVLVTDGLISEGGLTRLQAQVSASYAKPLGLPVGIIGLLQAIEPDEDPVAVVRVSDGDPPYGLKSFQIQVDDVSNSVQWVIHVALRHPALSPAPEMGAVSRIEVNRTALEQAVATVASVLGDGEVAITFKSVGTAEDGTAAMCLSGTDQIGMSDSEVWVPVTGMAGEFRPFRVVKDAIASLVKYNAADTVALLVPEDVRAGVHFKMERDGREFRARLATVY